MGWSSDPTQLKERSDLLRNKRFIAALCALGVATLLPFAAACGSGGATVATPSPTTTAAVSQSDPGAIAFGQMLEGASFILGPNGVEYDREKDEYDADDSRLPTGQKVSIESFPVEEGDAPTGWRIEGIEVRDAANPAKPTALEVELYFEVFGSPTPKPSPTATTPQLNRPTPTATTSSRAQVSSTPSKR